MDSKTCINDIRNFPEVKEIIKSGVEAFGRTWGKSGSRYHGSHIVFIKGDEIVLLHQHRRTKELSIDCFLKAEARDKSLFQEILHVLEKHGVFPKRE